LVTNVPSWALLLGMVIAVVGVSIAVQAFVRHRFPTLSGGAHNDVTKFVFGVVSFVFAFFLGFLVSNLWGQISTADALARGEGAAGVQLARDSTVFDKADGDRIQQSLLDYERAAEAEWPLAATGQSSTTTDEALDRLYTAYEQVQARTDAQTQWDQTSWSTRVPASGSSFTSFSNIGTAFVAGGTTRYADIQRLGGSTGSIAYTNTTITTLAIDNLGNISLIPEPSSLTLAGLAALALVTRRRR
jgi:cytoskeletal protein RodZ